MVLKPARLVALAGAAAFLGGACGNGVTAGGTFKEEMYRFPAALVSFATVSPGVKPLLGILWSDPFQRRADVQMPAEWFSTDLSLDTLATFNVSIYRPPPPGAIVRVDVPGSGDYAELAIADLALVDDRNGDGKFTPAGAHAEVSEDRYLGATRAALVYFARSFSEQLPSTLPSFPLAIVAAGHYALIDLQCSGPLSRGPAFVDATLFVLQPSQRLPEVRDCLRTHSP